MEHIFSVKNKVIVVTGASSGIGCHFSKVLAAAGAKIALGARRINKLAQLVDEISKNKGIAHLHELDVTNLNSIKKFVISIKEKLGPIDVLINNAGIDSRKNLFETEEMDWTPVIDTNLKGLVFTTQVVAKQMIENNRKGSIINISSVSDTLAFKDGNPAYMASKAGVAHFTHLSALQLAAANIRVNAIAPGVFKTEINEDLFDTDVSRALEPKIPLQRFGNLDDLNGALLLLCSDASQYMTGTILRVDGGLCINKL